MSVSLSLTCVQLEPARLTPAVPLLAAVPDAEVADEAQPSVGRLGGKHQRVLVGRVLDAAWRSVGGRLSGRRRNGRGSRGLFDGRRCG